MFDPYQHAHDLGVQLATMEQPDAGRWYPTRNLITLRHDLGPVAERCTLTHELGHVEMGHTSSTPKSEMLADRYAAEQLVDRDQLIDLMTTYPDHVPRWAHELEITMKIMRMYLTVHRLDLGRGRREPYRVKPMVLRALG